MVLEKRSIVNKQFALHAMPQLTLQLIASLFHVMGIGVLRDVVMHYCNVVLPMRWGLGVELE